VVDVEKNMWIIVSSVKVSSIVPKLIGLQRRFAFIQRIKYLVARKFVIERLNVPRSNVMKAFEQPQAMHCYVHAVILP
jgi:hypothetical protein